MNICCVCNKYTNSLRHNKFWDQKYCDGHLSDGTLRCITCHKFKEAGDIEYLHLGDIRMICSKCCSIAIKDSEQFKPIIENVHKFYESLNLKFDREVPISLVDGNEMRRLIGQLVLGVCEQYKLIRISVLSGLSDLEMGGTLAHEMMHAWLTLEGCEPWKLERSVEEGICNVMMYKWLEWFCSSSAFKARYKSKEKAQYAHKLKLYIVQRLETWEDQVNGQGFRDAMRAVKIFGFKTTLNYIVEKRKLPPVPLGCWDFLLAKITGRPSFDQHHQTTTTTKKPETSNSPMPTVTTQIKTNRRGTNFSSPGCRDNT